MFLFIWRNTWHLIFISGLSYVILNLASEILLARKSELSAPVGDLLMMWKNKQLSVLNTSWIYPSCRCCIWYFNWIRMLPSLPIYINILKPVALIENISGGSSVQCFSETWQCQNQQLKCNCNLYSVGFGSLYQLCCFSDVKLASILVPANPLPIACIYIWHCGLLWLCLDYALPKRAYISTINVINAIMI